MAGFRITDCTAQRAPGRLMRRVDKLMRAMIDDRLEQLGMGYAQWATLKLVHEGVVGNAGEVGRELGYTSGATTRLIDALEARGAIERIRDGGDRRVVRLQVTPAGASLVERGLEPVLDLWNEMVADFSQAEADQFIEMLLKLLRAVEAKAAIRGLPLAEATA